MKYIIRSSSVFLILIIIVSVFYLDGCKSCNPGGTLTPSCTDAKAVLVNSNGNVFTFQYVINKTTSPYNFKFRIRSSNAPIVDSKVLDLSGAIQNGWTVVEGMESNVKTFVPSSPPAPQPPLPGGTYGNFQITLKNGLGPSDVTCKILDGNDKECDTQTFPGLGL